MLQVKNTTPFVPGLFVFPDERGVDTLYVVLKATFSAVGGRVRVAEEQRPLVLADIWSGEPGQSGIRYASEVHLRKPATDVVLVGDAFAPRGRPAPSCLVGVSVGPVRKVVQVFGDRTWRTGLGGVRMTPPEPFLEMPLVYERAFGGACSPRGGPVVEEPRNPVGRGLWSHRSAAEVEGAPLPNVEDPSDLVDHPGSRPAPAGVGFVGPSWEPRRGLAGTYDAAWLGGRAPYLPDDFDPRFFQAASPGLVCPGHLRGGEPVEIANASAEGLERYRLPAVAVTVAVAIAGRVESPPLALETVLLEPGAGLVTLSFRAAVPCDKAALKISSVDLSLQALTGVERG